ncbi:hypothetical protein L6452_40292 [Arctium lappa]|uniref:Uncharacterized protein n=1 Tax=Arctium lappa TaxID=4217 RepID=A0ACB8XLJ0_ARCLA|nr:hypothetical protein L6452_40292 [Arctium lappa]
MINKINSSSLFHVKYARKRLHTNVFVCIFSLLRSLIRVLNRAGSQFRMYFNKLISWSYDLVIKKLAGHKEPTENIKGDRLAMERNGSGRIRLDAFISSFLILDILNLMIITLNSKSFLQA